MQFSVRASLEQFTLPHPGGEGQFKISVAAPAMVLPDARVPVLYVADGDLLFGLAAEIARAMMNVGVARRCRPCARPRTGSPRSTGTSGRRGPWTDRRRP